jgi:hypothetical protein
MRIVFSEPDGTRWDDAVRAGGGSVFHSSAWALYIRAADVNATPQFIRFEGEAGETRGYALGFRAQSRRPVVGALTRRFWLETLPMTGDAETLGSVLRLLEEAARDAGDVVLDIGSYAAGDRGSVLETLGYASRPRFEFVMSLEPTPDDLWKGMDGARRRAIRRGGRSGVIVEELSPEEGVGILRRLMDASLERIVQRGGRLARYAGDSAADPVRVLVETGVGRIVGARVGGDWVSAILLTTFDGRVYHVMSGNTRSALETAAPSVLFWECIQWSRSRGDREFNLGGCAAEALDPGSAEHGVYRYKAAFGGTQVRCVSGTKALHPVRLRLSRALHGMRGQYSRVRSYIARAGRAAA